MFAKIKDNNVVKFPYDYDDLQNDNPHTKFTGTIDLLELFNSSDMCIVHGYELVQVYIAERSPLIPPQVAVLSNSPIEEEGRWLLKWELNYTPPKDYCDTFNPLDSI